MQAVRCNGRAEQKSRLSRDAHVVKVPSTSWCTSSATPLAEALWHGPATACRCSVCSMLALRRICHLPEDAAGVDGNYNFHIRHAARSRSGTDSRHVDLTSRTSEVCFCGHRARRRRGHYCPRRRRRWAAEGERQTAAWEAKVRIGRTGRSGKRPRAVGANAQATGAKVCEKAHPVRRDH